MNSPVSAGAAPHARARYRYVLAGIVLSLILIGWGGWVTSIEAGLAVPDWPTSFGSLNPISTGFEDPSDPTSRWWMHPPILAEHGHRLLGALVGLWMLGLFLWTFLAEHRQSVRILAAGALALVVLQGVLGGLRVVWESLDLAVVHALGAQFFFSMLIAMAVITAPAWAAAIPASVEARRLSYFTAAAIYLQILLGALLRHPGEGINLWFTLTHVAGACAVLVLVVLLFSSLREEGILVRWAWSLIAMVSLQMLLGIMAMLTILYEVSVGTLSVWQVLLNSTHLVTGTLLSGFTVGIAVKLTRHGS